MGVNDKVGIQGAGVASKYHDEKMESAPNESNTDSSNPQIVAKSGSPQGLVMPSMGNPMMSMSGGKAVPGGMGETDSKMSMIPLSGSDGGALPSQGEVMSSNPQGHKKAPLAGKLTSKR
jgi:hypothetical protein